MYGLADTNTAYAGNNFLLRQAFVSAPLFGGTVNVGRVEANWAEGLTTNEISGIACPTRMW